MSGWRLAGTVAKPVGGVVVLALVVHRFGAEPFRRALADVDGTLVAAALAVTLLTTVCSAERWRVVAGSDRPPMAVAVRAYYRSQFLNVTLPGGVLGDADRAWRHGLRAVFWERTAGQLVQVVLAVLLLALVPSPFRGAALVGAGVLLAAGVGALLWRRLRRPAGIPGRHPGWPVGGAVSAVAVVGHLTLFVIAARASGVDTTWPAVLPLAVLVLLASALPVNVAGWGPREGAAAWVFGAAGLGTAAGLTTAVLYGTLVLVATLPGAVLLLVDAARGGVR
jgi:hypothetical protein